uniref:FBA domain-containing protein n=1 Tax=Callorhinchus milii TaxID=7868 RepID=A0A4W3J4D3_CALMI
TLELPLKKEHHEHRCFRLICEQWRELCIQGGYFKQCWETCLADWRKFSFLQLLHRNWLKNLCAEEGFVHWSLNPNGGGGFTRRLWKIFPGEKWEEVFCNSKIGCGCTYRECSVIQVHESDRVTIQQWSEAMWNQITYVFTDYEPGQDTQFWAGWFRIGVTTTPKLHL